jgi:hypothetical protein
MALSSMAYAVLNSLNSIVVGVKGGVWGKEAATAAAAAAVAEAIAASAVAKSILNSANSSFASAGVRSRICTWSTTSCLSFTLNRPLYSLLINISRMGG